MILASCDLRRKDDGVLRLRNPDQARIDALLSERIVTIEGGRPLTLAFSLRNLEILELVDVTVDRLHLTDDLVPKLTSLRLRNIPESYEAQIDISIRLPNLRHVQLDLWRGPGDALDDMLQLATRLESFRAYKLGTSDLAFASTNLTTLQIHRADELQSLSFWAPNLRTLSLCALFSLDHLDILDHHHLAINLPNDFQQRRIPHIDIYNSSFGPQVKTTLMNHRRTRLSDDDFDDDDDY